MLNTLDLGQRMPGRSAFTADWVVGHDGRGHKLLQRGEVVIEGGRILHVGRRFEGEVARRIDFGRALIAPGFIDLDALSDLDTTILGIDHQPAWAKGRVWPQSYVERGPYEMYSDDELAFQKRFSFAQLLRGGITTAMPIASLFYRAWGETEAEFDAAAEAARDLGLRVYLGPAYRSGGMVCVGPANLEPRYDEARGLAGLEAAASFIRRWHGQGDDLIRGALAPDRVETSTAALLQRSHDIARELDVPIRLHCAQGDMEVAAVRAQYGTTAPKWLESLGLLSPRLIAPHATRATDEDLAAYAAHGVSIVHCPLVSGRGGGALRSFARVREMGINIAMGTDTAPPDMVLNMAVGQIVSRVVDRSPEGATVAQLFEAATLGGAKALGRDDLGRLSAGARADIAVFDLADADMAPTIDPIATLVAGATARVCRTTIVDGRLSMHEGAVAGLDWVEARARAQRQFDGLVQKYPDRTWGHPPVAEIFTPSYPIERCDD